MRGQLVQVAAFGSDGETAFEMRATACVGSLIDERRREGSEHVRVGGEVEACPSERGGGAVDQRQGFP